MMLEHGGQEERFAVFGVQRRASGIFNPGWHCRKCPVAALGRWPGQEQGWGEVGVQTDPRTHYSGWAPMGSGMRSQCPEGRHRPLLGIGATPSRVQLLLASSGLEVGADKNVPPEPSSQTRGPSRRLQLPKCPAPQLRRSRMLLSKRGGPAGRRTGRVSGRSAGNPAAAILAGSNQLGAQGEARVVSLASS